MQRCDPYGSGIKYKKCHGA
ncbi:MAG: hypothetical protein G5701_04590 [Serratia symbiotica]|nr:hypothetical protein [Serratia symbiotica]